MKDLDFNCILISFALLLSILLPGAPCLADPGTSDKAFHKVFDGLFVGLEISTQNYFGGALIQETDILTRDSKAVTDLSLGYRWQLARGRLLVGLRLNYGLVNGDLENLSFHQDLRINYENDSQIGYGGEIGAVVGRRRATALFVYAYETERDFDVTIETPFGHFEQSDTQGVLRLGVGLELRLWRGVHLRATAGTGLADFGDRLLSEEVDGKLDVGLGVVYQL